jgi:hypothetical protein
MRVTLEGDTLLDAFATKTNELSDAIEKGEPVTSEAVALVEALASATMAMVTIERRINEQSRRTAAVMQQAAKGGLFIPK